MPFVRCRNYGSRITSRRTRLPVNRQLRFLKNQLILPQEQVWSCHRCSSRMSIWRRLPAAELRRNKRPLLLKLTAFRKARIRRRLGWRLSPRKSHSEDIHSRFVLGFPSSLPRPLLVAPGGGFIACPQGYNPRIPELAD